MTNFHNIWCYQCFCITKNMTYLLQCIHNISNFECVLGMLRKSNFLSNFPLLTMSKPNEESDSGQNTEKNI